MNAIELKEFRKKYSLTQEDISKIANVKIGTVQSWEYGKRNISQSAVALLRIYEEQQLSQEQNIPQGELKPKTYSHTLQVRVVSHKAQAGWADGYYNDEYLQDMPIITIDADQNHRGNYLAFEIQGDSMEPDYLEGDIVICREVQRSLWTSKLHFNQWDFVIAHNTQGIMLKAITDHDVQKGIITCHSLNPNHEDFTLRLADIRFLYNVVELRQHGKRKHLNRTRDFFI